MRRTTIAAITTVATLAIGAGAGSALALGSSSSSTPASTSLSPAAEDALVSHCTDLYNARNWAQLSAHCYDTTNFVDHTPENGYPGNWSGFKATTDLEDVAFPDWKTSTINLTAQGDRVIMHFVGTGTQTGPLGGLAPTGHKVTITGMRMFRIQHGRITDTWVNYDELGLLEQLGVLPKIG